MDNRSFEKTILYGKQCLENSVWKTVCGIGGMNCVFFSPMTPYFVSDEKKPSLTARHHPSERLCDACKDHVIWKRQSLQVVFRFHRFCRTAEFNQFRRNQLIIHTQSTLPALAPLPWICHSVWGLQKSST